MKTYRRILVATAGCALLACAVCLSLSDRPGSGNTPTVEPTVRELTRDQLELRDGRLFVKAESKPFQGCLIENFSPDNRKLEIEISDGKADGRSRGWFENGRREVCEIFVDGVSNGPRTRWYANGRLRSTAVIRHGRMVGRFTEWHENGVKATEMTLRADGKPDGKVTAWYPSGKLKSRVVFKDGVEVEKKMFDDDTSIATVGQE